MNLHGLNFDHYKIKPYSSLDYDCYFVGHQVEIESGFLSFCEAEYIGTRNNKRIKVLVHLILQRALQMLSRPHFFFAEPAKIWNKSKMNL